MYFDSYKGLSKESWMLSVVMLINRSGAMVLPFLGIYMNTELGFTLKEVGIVLSLYGVGSLIGTWLGGTLSDKIGSFNVQLFSLLATAPMFAIMPFFHSFQSFATIILITSIVNELLRPANSVAVTKFAKPENLTRAFSLNRMAMNLGFAIGPTMGGILSTISYDLLFYLNSFGSLFAAIMFYNFFKNRKEQTAVIKTQKEDVKERSPYKDGPFLVYNLVNILFCIAFFQLFQVAPLFLKQDAMMTETAIGLLMGYSGLVIFLTEMPIVNWLKGKFTIRRILIFGALLNALFFLISAVTVNHYWLYIAMTFMCFGEILVLPYTATVTAMRAGKNNKGAYMGLNGLTFSVAFIIAPFLGTTTADKFGYSTLWIAVTIGLIIAAFGFYFTTSKMVGDAKV